MGEIGNTFSGLSGKTKEDFGHGQASFVTYLNVFNNSIGQPNMIEKVEIDPKQFQVKQGDILFTTSSETPDEVGMACVWPVNLPNLYLNSFCFGFRPKKEIDINFYAHMLRSPQVRNQITLLAQGISRYNISKTKMMDIRIWLPSESEQRRIGRFLGNIDNLITLHQRKSVTIKKLKSGLLRKMILTVESTLTDVFLPLFTIDWEQRKLGEIGNTFSGLSG
ncbi:restriction endonuclease subunit S, partial [Faecalibaculum rodentium]|uniref:restriction endonuclease subunit S n=1 Tax=Faecalibaculum rodentium TaxID=1702221 RepID=UPI002493B193